MTPVSLFPEPPAAPVKAAPRSCSAEAWCILSENHPPPCKAAKAKAAVLAGVVVGDRVTLWDGVPIDIVTVTHETEREVWVGDVLYRRSTGSRGGRAWIKARPYQDGDDALVAKRAAVIACADAERAHLAAKERVAYDIERVETAQIKLVSSRASLAEAEAKLAAARAALEAK